MHADPPLSTTASTGTGATSATSAVLAPAEAGGAPEPATAIDIVITTPRLRLRPLRLGDASAVYAYMCDPKVVRHTLSAVHSTPFDAYSMLSYWSRCAANAPTAFVMFGIELRGAGIRSSTIIGDVSVRRPSADATEAEVGYTLHRELWGRGLATEAATAVIAWALANWRLDAVVARCNPRNRASIAVMKRLGMRKRERVRRGYHKNGRWRPSVTWAVSRERWQELSLQPRP